METGYKLVLVLSRGAVDCHNIVLELRKFLLLLLVDEIQALTLSLAIVVLLK